MSVRKTVSRLVASGCSRLVAIGFTLILGCGTDHGLESSPRLTLGVFRGDLDEDSFSLEFDRSYRWMSRRDGHSVWRKGVLDEATFAEVDALVRFEDVPVYSSDPSFISGVVVGEMLPGSPTRPLFHVVLRDDRYSATPSFEAWAIDSPETHEATKGLLQRAESILASLPR